MNPGEATRMAMRNLLSHKLRSLLTIVGVLIGIGSVITIVTLSAAFEASITGAFDDLDDRSIFVTATAAGGQSGPPDAGQFGTVFTDVDRAALAALPGVERVIASGDVTVAGLRMDDHALPFERLTATSPDDDAVRDPDLYHAGGVFEDGTMQVVLGWSLALQLGGDARDAEEPTIQPGDVVEVEFRNGTTQQATVAGVLAYQSSLISTSNVAAYAPLDPFYDVRIRSPTTDQVVPVFTGFTVFAQEGASVGKVRDAVDDYMTDESDAARLLEGLEVQILVATASDISRGISDVFDQVNIFLGSVAGVSLLVGGIMIATIQLISVTERTKEIGLMKAIGALDGDVLRLFLFEAAIIGLLGSVVGIAVGLAAGGALVRTLFSTDGVSFVVPYDWVGIAVAVGVLTGVVAGYVPARRATKVQPVEALNYE